MISKKMLGVLVGIIMIQSLLTLASAFDSEQGISAKVVPGIIDIYSPIDKTVFQVNNVLFDLKVRTFSNTVKNLWLIEGKNTKLLCSDCKEFKKELFFSTGEHSIKIKADFVNGDIAEENLGFTIDTNSNLYLYSSSDGVIKKATTKQLLDYLKNYEFELSYKREIVPDDSCSIRAKDGNIVINNEDMGSNNKINFYAVLKLDNGEGSFSAQKGKKRFSLNFKVDKTIENSEEFLILNILEKKSNKEYTLTLDKFYSTVSLSGEDLAIEGMKVYFMNECGSSEKTFYLIEKGAKTTRSIEEIRQILNDNPIFVNRYGNLRFLFSRFWGVRQALNMY